MSSYYSSKLHTSLAPTCILVHAGNSRRKGVSHDGTRSELDARADVCRAEAYRPAAQDHSGQSSASNSTCQKMQNVDEGCVNKRLVPGQSLGTWTMYNQCSSFAWSTIGQSRYGPQIGPVLPLCTMAEPDPDVYGPQLPRCERGPLGTTYGPR